MRRVAILAVSLVLTLAIVAPVAAMGTPTITRLGPSSIGAPDLAGTCDFNVEIVDSFSNMKVMEFPADANGDQLIRYTGGLVSTVENLSTHATVEYHYFGTVNYLLRANGTVDVKATGTTLTWFFDRDDLSVFEPGIYLITGKFETSFDPATKLTLRPESVDGTVIDVCAALS
jgi:hypothetical protein